MAKVIYTDVDLTLLDFNEPFERFVRSKGHAIPHGCTVGQAHLPDCYDIDPTVAAQLVLDFFHHPDFADLPPIAGSEQSVRRLHDAGWEFVAITACPDYVHEARSTNLQKVFGIEFLDVRYSGFGGCKRDILSGFEPTFFVEDSVKHAEVGLELGYHTFLINQAYNLDKDTRAQRVDTWAEIEGHLCTAG